MFKKLIQGEISLTKTFWVYGFLGIIFLTIIAKISSNMLYSKIGSADILGHYIKSFNLMTMDNSIIITTVFNISSMLILIFYNFCIAVAVWRSSAEHDKSVWLIYISRFSMFLMILICLCITF